MNKDVEKLADSDPFLDALLDFKRYFFYADWKLFRAGEASKLAEKLIGKLRKGTLVLVVLLVFLAVRTAGEAFKCVREDDSFLLVCSIILLLFYVIFGSCGIAFTIRERRRLEEIVKTHGDEA